MEEYKEPFLFLCQSSKDFSVIDEIINRNLNLKDTTQTFYIIFVGQKATHSFAEELYKNIRSIQCLYIQFDGFRQDFFQLKNFYRAKKILKIIEDIHFSRIYFFNVVFDHLSFFLIDNISFKKLIFLDYFQIKRSITAPNISTKFKKFIIKLIFNQEIICLENQIPQTKMKHSAKIFLISKFIYKSKNKKTLSISGNIKNVLFYDSGDLNSKDGEILEEIAKFLEGTDYKFCIKAHPLHPLSSVIEKSMILFDSLVRINGPAEFINYENIPVGITKTSAALNENHDICISILKLQNSYDQLAFAQLGRKHFKVYFPTSMIQLKKFFSDL